MTSLISILLVDDHALVRETLGERLNREPDIDVVGIAKNAEEAVTLAVQLRPLIILMDIDMPGLLCFDAARTIQTQCPDTRIVFLSAFFNDRYIEEALACGACGYITKNEAADSVVAAVREVATGGAYFSPDVRSRIIVDPSGPRLAGKKHSRLSTLTSREVDILRYVAKGMSKREIARTAHISVKTVENHCTHLMSKLDIHDRVELTRYAIREGLAEI